MAIRDTDRAEFIRRLSLLGDLERLIGKEVEWFANAAGNVIGTIALAARDRGWNFVVLRKNKLGNFQASDRRENLFSLDEARMDCLQAMGMTDCNAPNDLPGRDRD
jgi:hypothetical protein